MTTATSVPNPNPNTGPAAASSPASTRAPFPSRYLAVELRRRLLNRRNVLFSLVMPIALYFAFASSQEFKDTWIGHANVSAAIMVSMALYGAIVTATSAGASVSVEIAQGWARTLNLTPLRPYLNTWWGSLLFVLLLYIPAARFLNIDTFTPRRFQTPPPQPGARSGQPASTNTLDKRREKNRYAGVRKSPPRMGGRR